MEGEPAQVPFVFVHWLIAERLQPGVASSLPGRDWPAAGRSSSPTARQLDGCSLEARADAETTCSDCPQWRRSKRQVRGGTWRSHSSDRAGVTPASAPYDCGSS